MSSQISRIRGAFILALSRQQAFSQRVGLLGRIGLLLGAAFTQSGMSFPTLTPTTIEYGRAGVVGNLFKGGELSCGGTYSPNSITVFHPTLPCGSAVRVYNPETQQSVEATVDNQAVMFRSGYGRVADISVGTAEAIGLDADAPTAQAVVLHPLQGRLEAMMASLPETLPSLPSIPSVQDDTLTVLTRNLVAECGNCGDMGMLAVGRVTVNRAEMGFGGATSVRKVVYAPNQFSWVKSGPFPTPSHGSWSSAKKLAKATLTDQVSGAGLGLFYRMGWQADHFYATSLAAPKWAHRMERIAFAPHFERTSLRHYYFASGRFEVASR